MNKEIWRMELMSIGLAVLYMIAYIMISEGNMVWWALSVLVFLAARYLLEKIKIRFFLHTLKDARMTTIFDGEEVIVEWATLDVNVGGEDYLLRKDDPGGTKRWE